MSGWIKLEKDLLTDPRTIRLARFISSALKIDANQSRVDDWRVCHGRPLPGVTLVLGALAQLWLLADTHVGENDVLPLGIDEIDELIGIPGFCENLPAEWLQVVNEDNVRLPNYHAHNGTTAKERALAARRQEKHREIVTGRRDALKRDSHGRTLPDPDPDQTNTKTKTSEDDMSTRAMNGQAKVARELEVFKDNYPHRSGAQPWLKALKAIHARLLEGHSWDEILAGAGRYGAFCAATGKVGTEYVMQASTFCGPEKHFLLPWACPPKPETASEAILRKLNEPEHEAFEHEQNLFPRA